MTARQGGGAVSAAHPQIPRASGPSGGPTSVAPASVDRALASPGTPLEPAVRPDMERSFGHDFSRVRVHTDAPAARSAGDVAAEAYTVGRHIVFAAGRYAPHTPAGRHLLAHELVHTAQQGAAHTLRRQAAGGAKSGERKTFVIPIPSGISTKQEYFLYIEMKIFGRVVNVAWTSSGPAVDAPSKHVGKPVNVSVATWLLEMYGAAGGGDGKAEKEEADKAYKGLGEGEKGAIDVEINQRYYAATGEAPGTKIKPGEAVKASIWNSLKQQVLADRKALETLPETVKTLLGPSNFTPENYRALVELGQTLAQLSDAELKAFFVVGPGGATITPADYPRLLSIAKKLANLPPEARQDYLSRVNATTTSLAQMEAQIDDYLQFRAERENEIEAHEEATKPLLGAEDLYTAYRDYKDWQRTVGMARALKSSARDKAAAEESYEYLQERLRESEKALLAALKDKGFESIAAFEAALETYRLSFRTQAVNLALDVLARYEHMLFEESQRLKQGAAATIAQGIGATKASQYYEEYHRQEGIARSLQMAHEPKETWWLKPYQEAKDAAAAAKASAEQEVLKGSGADPLIKERKIDLERLAGADAAGVQSYLSAEITDRETKAQAARHELNEDPDRVFRKMPDLVAATYKMLGVEPTSIYGRVINDYIEDEGRKHLLSDLALAALALALAFLVPGGGWLAAAALVASAGLSTYQAYQAYKEYQEQERDYELGFLSEEPSLFWVALAIAGAAVDLGVAASAVVKGSATALKSLKGAMLGFSKDGDLARFVASLEATGGLDRTLLAALRREAEASLATKQAWKTLMGVAMRPNAFVGAVADPEVATSLFRLLTSSVKRGVNTLTKLSADARFLEIAGDLAKMSAADRDALEAAFAEVKTLVKAGAEKGMDDASLASFVDRWALNRGKPGFQTKLLDEMKAWKPPTPAQKKALDELGKVRGKLADLKEEKATAEADLADLLAKPKEERTAEVTEEIKELRKRLRELDPTAEPARIQITGEYKRPPGLGEIAETELKVAEAEKEAEKAGISLYKRMRDARPSYTAENRALKQPSVEDIAAPLKGKPTPKQVDHIVSVREIVDMDGFADLPLKDQKDIVNMPDNLVAMDGSANASKQDWSWKSWKNASNYYEQSTIDAMIKREADVRALIEKEIQARLAKLKTKP
jgi:hypothetical protein